MWPCCRCICFWCCLHQDSRPCQYCLHTCFCLNAAPSLEKFVHKLSAFISIQDLVHGLWHCCDKTAEAPASHPVFLLQPSHHHNPPEGGHSFALILCNHSKVAMYPSLDNILFIPSLPRYGLYSLKRTRREL